MSDVDNLGGTPVHDAAEQGHVSYIARNVLMRTCVVGVPEQWKLSSVIGWGRAVKIEPRGR